MHPDSGAAGRGEGQRQALRARTRERRPRDAATHLSTLYAVTPGDVFSVTQTGILAGAAYFWIAPVTTTGARGSASGSCALTLT